MIITEMNHFQRVCLKKMVEWYHINRPKVELDLTDVFVVWSCKTLQNSKALLSTTLYDGMYYECTLNGDKKEIYFDAYKKFENKCIKLEEEK